ncbi:MAG: SWIM zinc finger family protein, partial [Planctomycetia bacterium]
MIAQHSYAARSTIFSGFDRTRLGFAADLRRDPTFFHGVVGKPVELREALSVLHSVVVSDLKYRPRDRFAFQAWLEEQDRKFLSSLGLKNEKVRARLQEIEERLGVLGRQRDVRLKDFYESRKDYFEWAYTQLFELSYIYDPVVAVHPDEISFEAFSRDESTYARLAAKYGCFSKIDEFECGTTNIDFSAALSKELDKMRTYRKTEFGVDP